MSNHTKVAVVGMSGEFPCATNIAEFWNNLIAGKESISTLSPMELSEAGIPNSIWNKANYVARAGVLNAIDEFAAEFFGYSPREASLIDPQQRKLLEHAWHACEDAAINPLQYNGAIGVFVGSSLNTYLINNLLSHPNIQESEDIQQILFGNGADYLATRIAYQLNCRGSALNIQTACSTSLVAVHEACQQLLSYQVDVALAGGVSISVPQKKGYLHSVDGLLSPDGHCKPFSNEANGTLFSSGLGIVVLKRLDEALADGNPIYAVITGSAVNNDGHQKMGFTAPSIDGQAEVIALAQAMAGVAPGDIGYIEAHGTGTQLGDPIELAALQQVFSEQTSREQFCVLGSLKSNIGHLDVASGIAGFIKTVLILQHQKIPKTLNHSQATSKFDWKTSAFYVNSDLKNLTANERLANAGVSCFGIGGTNAHVVLEQYVDDNLEPAQAKRDLCMLVFSAKTIPSLHAALQQFADLGKEGDSWVDASLDSIARTLQEGRAALRYRTVLIVESLEEAMTIIQQKTYELVSCEQELESIQAPPIETCDRKELLALAQKWLSGYRVDWASHYATNTPRMVHLPKYPFEKARYWVEPYQTQDLEISQSSLTAMQRRPLDDWFYQPTWKPAPSSSFAPVEGKKKTLVFIYEDVKPLLNESILQQLGEVVFIYPAQHFAVMSNSAFQLDQANSEHYIRLFDLLKEDHFVPDYIVHALSLTSEAIASSIDVFDAQQNDGLLSSLYLIQAWDKIFQNRTLKFTVLTNRLNRIAEAPLEPHKAPILAAVKVIPKEYPLIQAQLIDVDFIDHAQYQPFQFKQLVQDIAKSNYTEEEIVLRGMVRWVRTYVQFPLDAVAEKPFAQRKTNTILIVGGLGQLGLDIAEYFAQFTGMKLALVARKNIAKSGEWDAQLTHYEESHPMRLMLERLIKIRSQGCVVEVFSADISDREQTSAMIQAVESKMGPIHGVIHAAGETVNGIISMKTAQSLQESYQAKVYGSYHLCELFVNKPLDFMILCSSMNAVIGGLGQLDNTAANAFIDYCAEYYSTVTGRPILSINWGAINMDRPLKVNVVPQFADLSAEHKRNRMNDDETREVYTRLLTHQVGPRIVISTLDMNDVLLNWNRVASVQELDKELESNVQPAEALLEEDLPINDLEIWIANAWARILGMNPIGRFNNFFSLGGHSLAAVQFMTRILEEHQLKIHVMTLYELPTIAEFAKHMEQLVQKNTPVEGGL